MSELQRRVNVYAISRKLWDHPAFEVEPYTQKQAWAWLIGAAAYEEKRIRAPRGSVVLRRGEFSFSVRFLALKWLWSKSRTARFMVLLKKWDMVRDTVRDSNKVYYINNYNRFQIVKAPSRDSNGDVARNLGGTSAGHQRDKEEDSKDREDSYTKNKPRAKARVGLVLPGWIDPQIWKGYEEMRKKMRAPLTERAKQTTLGTLDKLRAQGHDANAVLDQSIQRGWRGVFPIPTEADGHERDRRSPHAKFLAGSLDALKGYERQG